MASFASVKEFGERMNTLERLDILIASAGVGSRARALAADWLTFSYICSIQ